jgi:hypothetical protein
VLPADDGGEGKQSTSLGGVVPVPVAMYPPATDKYIIKNGLTRFCCRYTSVYSTVLYLYGTGVALAFCTPLSAVSVKVYVLKYTMTSSLI